MAPLTAPPSTSALSKAASQEAGVKRYEVTIGDHQIDLVLLHDRINIYLDSGGEDPAGMVRFGSTWSGALWLRGEFVGEFSEVPEGDFTIVEVEEGFKKPMVVTGMDPLVYLIGRLVKLPNDA